MVRLDTRPESEPTDWVGAVKTYGLEGDVSSKEKAVFMVWSDDLGRLLVAADPKTEPIRAAAAEAARSKLVLLALIPPKSSSTWPSTCRSRTTVGPTTPPRRFP